MGFAVFRLMLPPSARHDLMVMASSSLSRCRPRRAKRLE
jgi:hypothetical protein